MTEKQFLEVMDDIGSDLIDNFLGIPSESYYVPKRTPVWKTAVSAAAVLCVITAGISAAVKLHSLETNIIQSEDAVNSESLADSDNSVKSDALNSDTSKTSRNTSAFPFSFSFEGSSDMHIGTSEEVYKANHLECATVDIEECSILSSGKVFISITSDISSPESNILTEEKEIAIGVRGSYSLKYDDKNYTGTTYLFIRILDGGAAKLEGNWTP